jgi:hypothetical protein
MDTIGIVGAVERLRFEDLTHEYRKLAGRRIVSFFLGFVFRKVLKAAGSLQMANKAPRATTLLVSLYSF